MSVALERVGLVTCAGRYSSLVDDLQDDGSAIDDPAVQAFDAALEAAIARLPDQYRAQLATVAIVVADEATPVGPDESSAESLSGTAGRAGAPPGALACLVVALRISPAF